jgi:hypothetical protein
MTPTQAMHKMVKGYSFTALCREMEAEGMDRKTINETIDEAKRMKRDLLTLPTEYDIDNT